MTNTHYFMVNSTEAQIYFINYNHSISKKSDMYRNNDKGHLDTRYISVTVKHKIHWYYSFDKA